MFFQGMNPGGGGGGGGGGMGGRGPRVVFQTHGFGPGGMMFNFGGLNSAFANQGFARQQQQLLEALWPLLATGGMLLYSTCSVLPEENWQVVQRFLERNADAAEKPIIADWGQACEVGRQLLPTLKGHDGFYYSRIEKA